MADPSLRRLIIEHTAAEIDKAVAAGDGQRARKLAALQREVLARVSRDMVAEGAPAVPRPRPVPGPERAVS